MQPNNGQNYWQPEDGEVPTAPPVQNVAPIATPTQQPTPAQTVAQPTAATEAPSESVSWEASESVSHERDGLWFIGFIIIFITLLGVSVWLQQWTFTALIVIMAFALVVFIRRPSRVLKYSLSFNGLHINEQYHSFDEFRSFGVIEDGALFSVMLMPTKRFGQAITIYFTENEGEKIVDILGAYLPMEELHFDFLDNLLRRLRLQ